MKNLKGKRLLVIGCGNYAQDIQDYCRKNEIIIIVAGHPLSERTVSIAAEAYDIDVLDKGVVIQLIHERRIDGFFVGGNEDIISAMIDVSEETGLPFYATRKVWDITSNKEEFKKFCALHNIPVPQEYNINIEEIDGGSQEINYPLVLKPVDSCGSRGVNLCHNQSELACYIEEAKNTSKSKEFLAEEYIRGQEIVVYYTFCDGKVTLTSMCDKLLRQGGNDFNPLADVYKYPSEHLNEYCEKYDKSMREMLLDMGIRDGITSIQGFYTGDGQFKFFEMGYRLGGTAQYRYTKRLNGISSFEMMIKYALTGEMDQTEQEKDNAFFNKICCTFSLLSKGGVVGEICGLEEAKKEDGVLCIENRYQVGDTIKATRTVSQFHIRMFLVTNTIDEMKCLIQKLQKLIKVYDVNGNSMLITDFDVNRLK